MIAAQGVLKGINYANDDSREKAYMKASLPFENKT
jgi:hypothetical protein